MKKSNSEFKIAITINRNNHKLRNIMILNLTRGNYDIYLFEKNVVTTTYSVVKDVYS
ncbi:MAG: hypothetical protein KAH05_01240 [Clostridiales bacterium]|nr:hypothetical protein [Clostridiales bacterium]